MFIRAVSDASSLVSEKKLPLYHGSNVARIMLLSLKYFENLVFADTLRTVSMLYNPENCALGEAFPMKSIRNLI